MSRTFVAGLFAVVSIPVCAAIAVGAFLLADGALGRVVSQHDPIVVLFSGVLGMWIVVLFGLLTETAGNLADRYCQAKILHASRSCH
jgi:hypothetical protein